MFLALKKHLGGKKFDSDAEVQKEVNTWLREADGEWYSAGIDKFIVRMRKNLGFVRCRKLYTPEQLLLLYKVQIRPSLNIAPCLGCAPKHSLKLLDFIQNRAVRLIDTPNLTKDLHSLKHRRRRFHPLREAVHKKQKKYACKVKATLVANNCSDAFWMGNLRNKDLEGEDILSQSTAAETDIQQDDEEELPDDDSDADESGNEGVSERNTEGSEAFD
nr:unnamed protein product [Callosobruchus analis]